MSPDTLFCFPCFIGGKGTAVDGIGMNFTDFFGIIHNQVDYTQTGRADAVCAVLCWTLPPLQDAMASAAGMEGMLVMLHTQNAASGGEDSAATSEVIFFLATR